MPGAAGRRRHRARPAGRTQEIRCAASAVQSDGAATGRLRRDYDQHAVLTTVHAHAATARRLGLGTLHLIEGLAQLCRRTRRCRKRLRGRLVQRRPAGGRD